jgi:uncharacterized protein
VTAGGPLSFPLAGLLGEPPGASRTWELAGLTIGLPDDLRLSSPIQGTLGIARTNRGVLVDARLRAALAGECARCLREIEIPIEVRILEEALPSIDLASGHALDRSAEPDVVRLDDHHEIDLEPLVVDSIVLEEPIAPLCEPDCPGLCPTCGERLDAGHVDHGEDAIDPRLAALRRFAVDDETESE